MATNLPPPKALCLSGNASENFKLFKQQYELYVNAIGLSTASKERRSAILLNLAGEEALKIYNGFTWAPAVGDPEGEEHVPAEDKLDPELILEKFQRFCTPKTNVTYERYKFHRYTQSEGESFDNFLSQINTLVSTCAYGELKDDFVRDKIVLGINSDKVRARLLRDGELTLEKAINECRAEECSGRWAQDIKGETSKVQAVQHRRKGGPRDKGPRSNGQQGSASNCSQASNSRSCRWCGKEVHPRERCPAKDSKCNKCKRPGHWGKVCRSSKGKGSVQEVAEVQSDSDEYYFLGSISDESYSIESINNRKRRSAWFTEVQVSGQSLKFAVDTGADVTVISKAVYDTQFSHFILQKPDRPLSGPDQSNLSTLGFFTAELKKGDQTIREDIYVFPKGSLLLGRDACADLGVVKFIGKVTSDPIQSAEFGSMFKGLGKLEGEYKIKIEQNAEPYSVMTPRRISIPLLPLAKAELDKLIELDVIERCTEPSEWCSPMVVVPKGNGKVRICVDLTKLNEVVKRERIMLPTVDYTIALMGGAKVFSKLDANAGFHQICLDEDSRKLTTFISPFGRFRYKRIPFGIKSGPEKFQSEIYRILGGQQGVVCLMDDIVVFGKNQEEHDERLVQTLTRLKAAGVTLNKDKCQFSKSQIDFLGHRIGVNGVESSPEKVEAILKMRAPENVSEVRGLMGTVNQLMKFVPNLATMTQPLRELLSSHSAWCWGPAQEQAFKEIKQCLTSSPVLQIYDPSLETKVSADASSYGLGGVLLQKHGDRWAPVAYASKSLLDVEKRYAQIEKEALASTFACERFTDYILGKDIILETDHKPLVPLLSTKELDQLPVRIQRMRMRLMRYSFTPVHVPGKLLYTADTLSRSPTPAKSGDSFHEEVNLYAHQVIAGMPISDSKLDDIMIHQQEDEACRQIMNYVAEGWPEKHNVKGLVSPYFAHRAELTVVKGLLMMGPRGVIPSSMKLEVLDKIHDGHQGIVKCKALARNTVWWPSMMKNIEELIENCRKCQSNRKNPPEPLVPTMLPQRPWQYIATDVYELNKRLYLVMIDYYSRWIEVASLSSTASAEVIDRMKRAFSRFGIPDQVKSDNASYYTSREFKMFTLDYGFRHVTSSPGHASGNGEAERAVQTAKRLLAGSQDPYLALLQYRATPLANGYSPAELMMSRRLKTKVPVAPSQLSPNLVQNHALRQFEDNHKTKQKLHFDRRHSARPLVPLEKGDEVMVQDRGQSGIVVEKCTPRSYVIHTDTGSYRRNRVQINKIPPPPPAAATSPAKPTPVPVPPSPKLPSPQTANTAEGTGTSKVYTRSGRQSKPSSRLKDYVP
nr:uncharacterized protein K02A2.6-like [Pocillopora verrucosa]